MDRQHADLPDLAETQIQQTKILEVVLLGLLFLHVNNSFLDVPPDALFLPLLLPLRDEHLVHFIMFQRQTTRLDRRLVS